MDDDSWSHHQHDAFGFTTNTAVLEQATDVWNLVKNWYAGHVSSFSKTLDASEQNCTTVWNTYCCRDTDLFLNRLLNGKSTAAATSLALLTLLTTTDATLTAATLATAASTEAALTTDAAEASTEAALAAALTTKAAALSAAEASTLTALSAADRSTTRSATGE